MWYNRVMIQLNIAKKNISVTDISVDSRKVVPGSVFIAYRGVNVDSHNFIPQSIQKGAKYIVGERPLKDIKPLLGDFPVENYINVGDGRKAWAVLEAQRYGNPQNKLKIIGITGTDGKTTTCHLLYYIFMAAGKRIGISTTTGAFFDGHQIDTGAHTTTPPPSLLFKILKEMVDAGLEYGVLEITSHALAQDRVYGINLEASGITNVTHEHLDLHGTYENLLKAKARIFKMAKKSVVIGTALGIKDIIKLFPNDQDKELIKIKDYPEIIDKSRLSKKFFNNFPGEYNLYNAAIAAKIAEIVGIGQDAIYKGLNTAIPPEGRFYRVPNRLGLNIVIDFAHTANGIRNVLTVVNKLRKRGEKIIVVFGSAGERDKAKRPLMGQVAAELADEVILTSEDPRSEDAYDIARDIMLGAPEFPFIVIVDRVKAIGLALSIAKRGDWVLALGKGHEPTLSIGGKEYEWSEKKVVENALRTIGSR